MDKLDKKGTYQPTQTNLATLIGLKFQGTQQKVPIVVKHKKIEVPPIQKYKFLMLVQS